MLPPQCFILFIYLFLAFHPVPVVTSCLSFQLLHPVHLPLPFVSCRSFRYLLPFASTLLSSSSCSSFRFNSSISLPPSFRCNLSLPFVTPFLSFQLFFIPFVTSSLSFQLQGFCSLYIVSFVLNFKVFSSFRYFLPGALTLPSSSCTSSFHFKAFMSLLPFLASTLTCGSFTSSFRFMPFISLPPSFRFNSSFLFVLLFLSFQLVHFIASVLSLQPFPSIRYSLPFVSTLFHPVRYFFPFVSTIGLLFPIHRFFRFKL